MHDSLESRISAALWDWRFTDTANREQVIADSDLALMFEFWMPFSEIEYTRKLGTWCDGIPLLHVSNRNRTAFNVTGVGYFPDEFAPFEHEFHFANRRDLVTTKIIFKWGMLDGHSHLRTFGTSKDPSTVYAQRPQLVQQWAVAVELTPQT